MSCFTLISFQNKNMLIIVIQQPHYSNMSYTEQSASNNNTSMQYNTRYISLYHSTFSCPNSPSPVCPSPFIFPTSPSYTPQSAITTASTGRSWDPVGVSSTSLTYSIPCITRPNTTCLPIREYGDSLRGRE